MPSNMPSLSDFMNSGQSGDFLDYVRRQNQGRQIPSNDPALAQMVARSGTIPVPAEAQSLQGPVSAPDPSQVRGPQALEMTDEQRKAYLAGGANFRGPMPMSAGQAQQAGAAAGEGASQTLQQNVPGLNMGVTGQQPGMQLPPGGYHQSIGGVTYGRDVNGGLLSMQGQQGPGIFGRIDQRTADRFRDDQRARSGVMGPQEFGDYLNRGGQAGTPQQQMAGMMANMQRQLPGMIFDDGTGSMPMPGTPAAAMMQRYNEGVANLHGQALNNIAGQSIAGMNARDVANITQGGNLQQALLQQSGENYRANLAQGGEKAKALDAFLLQERQAGRLPGTPADFVDLRNKMHAASMGWGNAPGMAGPGGAPPITGAPPPSLSSPGAPGADPMAELRKMGQAQSNQLTDEDFQSFMKTLGADIAPGANGGPAKIDTSKMDKIDPNNLFKAIASLSKAQSPEGAQDLANRLRGSTIPGGMEALKKAMAYGTMRRLGNTGADLRKGASLGGLQFKEAVGDPNNPGATNIFGTPTGIHYQVTGPNGTTVLPSSSDAYDLLPTILPSSRARLQNEAQSGLPLLQQLLSGK